jgi:hypothetical protein
MHLSHAFISLLKPFSFRAGLSYVAICLCVLLLRGLNFLTTVATAAHGRSAHRIHAKVFLLVQVLRSEGPMTFYNGFATYYVRIAPHAMITLMAVEFLKDYV